MAQRKLYYMPFCTSDWMTNNDLRLVSLEARGLWIDMLCLMHQSPRRGYLQTKDGKPFSLDQIARLTGCSTEEVSRCLQELEDSGVHSCTEHGVIYCRRTVREERKRQKCAEAGKKGGGNPTFKGQRKGRNKGDTKGQSKGCSNYNSNSDSEFSPSGENEQAEALYAAYPRHEAKPPALRAIIKALTKTTYEYLLHAVQEYAKSREGKDKQFTPLPASWFNQERWNDDRSLWFADGKTNAAQRRSDDNLDVLKGFCDG